MNTLNKSLFCIVIALFFYSAVSFAQIEAPGHSVSFPTDYTSGYINAGGENDIVYVFCGNQNQHNIGELSVDAPGCSVIWFVFDGFSFVELGQTGQTAVGLSSGFYMATVDCGGGNVNCYRAWVWVNQTLVEIDPIAPGCETFTLSGNVDVMDNTFVINDPPGIDFTIDETTFIQVCFWANHTYVSDLGFYLKAPGHHTTEPGNVGVVELLPSPSAWNTDLPWSVTGCSPEDEAVPCNSGNNLEEFCFSTHLFLGGPELEVGNPNFVPCVCDMTTPLEGIYASAGEWDNIYGFEAGSDGWAVQVYDCEYVDVGGLTYVRLTFVGESECGATTIVYDSGEMYSPINDNSCNAATASIYVVPPMEPPGDYTVTSQITGYSWTCTGSSFTGNELSHQIVAGTADFPQQTSDFILTVTETINVPGNPSCNTSAAATFETLPVDATITPVGPVCANDAPFLLQAADGGGTWTTNAPPGSVQVNTFYPQIANAGTWNVSYSIGGPCPDDDQIQITVYESIEVENFSDLVCDANNDFFTVSFDVIGSTGNPAGFYVDAGSGNQWYNGSYSQQFPSPSEYNLTITDANGCSEIIITGYRDCGCTTFAGSMSSTAVVHLCDGECTDDISHNGNQVLDGNDTFQFILHDGTQFPAVPIAVNNNAPVFCFNQIPNGQFGQTYYVSAIAGNNVGGNVDINDPCYSQSPGTPVIWHQIPTAHIPGPNFTTCSLTTELVATEPGAGMIGTWTANQPFTPLGGASYNDNELNVVVNNYGEVDFTWTVSNNICEGSDQITVTFIQSPTAYAGENFYVCGNQAELGAEFSYPGQSTGQWSGNASFNPQTAPDATATVNTFGPHTFLWREYVADCYSEDYVTVTFIQEPNPTTTANFDTVCGVVYHLQAFNVQHSGVWSAVSGGEVLNANYDDINSPNTIVIIPNYDELYKDVTFTWTETNQVGGVACVGTASINVTFAKQPVASVGPNDFEEVCGTCVTLNADITGSEWATGQWLSKDISIEFIDGTTASDPNATICIPPLGSFGDSAHVEVELLWIMSNTGCVSIDTMTVVFYRRPNANAGLDNAVCDRDYCVGAVYSLPQTANYTPTGTWSVASRPNPAASANFESNQGDSVCVTVTHFGVWEFRWRENNAYLSSCFSADTVSIEFVEIPVVDAGEDKDVCGTTTQLEATSSDAFSGTWLPNGASFVDYEDPHTATTVSVYGPLNYVWLESNQATTTTLACTSTDTVQITFWRIPDAVILTDPADSTTCGLTFDNLRAQLPGTGITGYWWNETDPDAVYGNPNSHNTHVTVNTYGYHDFYWIAANGPTYQPEFCLDTAGPLRIHFIEIPTADAGGDTLFCGYSGSLNANPSVGTGVWSTPSSQLITFDEVNNPNSGINSQVLTGSANPYFNIIWTEDNTNGCTDRDTIKVRFARIPSSKINIVPPKCIGEPATISADEDSLSQYSWNFYSGIIDSIAPENAQGGLYEYFVYWANEDTAHNVSLIATNYWGCQSLITMDTVFEPPIPEFDVIIVSDTCLLGKGGIIFEDTLSTNAFYWIDSTVGPTPGTPITAVYNLPAGEYPIRARYRTVNQHWYNYYIQIYGNANCTDTIYYEIEPIGLMEAMFEVPPHVFLEDLVAPEALVTFNNLSDYAGVRRRCIWHFGDGNTLTSCDEQVEHVYTDAGCYEPFLIIMNRDLQECRDTAFIDVCIEIDNMSSLEIPNVFTPNGDGINDFFQVKAQTLRTFQGYILNRWGTVIYEWTNWQDEEAGWDGKLPGGSSASSGVYYYVIKATGMDDEEYDEKGALHLYRD